MIKCTGYYLEFIDEELCKLIGKQPPEPEMIETVCYLIEPTLDNPIQSIFQLEGDKMLVTYLNGFEALIKYESKVLDQLI